MRFPLGAPNCSQAKALQLGIEDLESLRLNRSIAIAVDCEKGAASSDCANWIGLCSLLANTESKVSWVISGPCQSSFLREAVQLIS